MSQTQGRFTVKNDKDWDLTISTERLILRPYVPADHAAWLDGFLQRLPKQSQYDRGQIDMSKCDAEWYRKLCQRHQQLAHEDNVYILGIFSHEGKHIGHIDIATIRRADNQWANLGYNIHNHSWRQGYAKEAVRPALVAGFEKLGYHRIEAAINLDNEASIALAKSVGMIDEGIRRGFFYEDGGWVDHRIFGAIPGDVGLEEKVPLVEFGG